MTAVIVAGGLLAGCGSSSESTKDLGAQDKAVEQVLRLEAVQAQIGATEQHLAQRRQAAAVAAELKRATLHPIDQVVLAKFGLSLEQLCPKVKEPPAVGKAQRHAQRVLDRMRKRALYYLNLSCPPSV